MRVLKPLDQHGGWDILTAEGMRQAELLVDQADHAHLAFPCRSFTTARRSDQYGTVEVVRTEECPDGWGSAVAVEGNQILQKAISLAFRILDRQSTFSMENPEPSFAWAVSFIQKLKKADNVKFIGLDQCPFGARTPKATCILGNSPWMSALTTRCQDVRPHAHLEGGLTGKMWDPVTNTMVWKTSKAAEYPQGLCYAWAKELKSGYSQPRAGATWLAEPWSK